MESTRQRAHDSAKPKQHPNRETAEASAVGGAQREPASQLQQPAHPGFGAGDVISLQRSVGNGSVTRALNRRVQRHPEGKALPDLGDQVGEIQDKAQSAPEATRTKQETKTQTGDAKRSGTEFKKSQKLKRGAMSLASAQKILQGAFGGVKDIVPGTIVILKDQKACSEKYDEVCMNDGLKRPDGSDWQKGDCAKDDAAAGVQTEGFAWKGTVYVNGETTLVTATAHEILHNNTAAGFRAAVGETFNEGITEMLARRAISNAGVRVPSVTAYPDQVKFAKKLQSLVGESVIADAYFGGAATLVTKYEDLKGKNTWATLKTAAEALDDVAFKKALKAKKVK